MIQGMDNKQDKDLQVIKDKLEEVQSILDYLSHNYKFRYSLHYNILNNSGVKCIYEDHLYSDQMDNSNILFFRQQLEELYDTMNIVPNLIKTGEMLVVCLDDRNPPKDIGPWIQKDGVYAVDLIHRTKQKGVYSYRLRGLTPNPPYDGYNSKRFKIIQVIEQLN
jgi:hypothetical protein